MKKTTKIAFTIIGAAVITAVTALVLTRLVTCCMDGACVRTNAYNCNSGGGTIMNGVNSCHPNPC